MVIMKLASKPHLPVGPEHAATGHHPQRIQHEPEAVKQLPP
jgi:hypothetical protein